MRYAITGIAVGVVVALLTSLHAVGHALPLKHKWSSLSLTRQEAYVKRNLWHARTAQAWVKRHRELYNARSLAAADTIIQRHRKLERKSSRNLAAIQRELYERSLWPWCRSGECVKTLLRRIFVEDPEGAVTVAGCESGWHADPVSGLSMTGQYVGVLQLGTSERAGYGHVGSGLYASSDPYTAISAPAWEQIVAAHNLFRAYGGWGPWQCLPDGGLRW